jgi:hypothetical protein
MAWGSPSWTDLAAIVLAAISGVYTFGVMEQKIRTLEDKAKRSDTLERDVHVLSERMRGLEVSMRNVEQMLIDMKNELRMFRES